MNPTNEEFFCDIECKINEHHPDCAIGLKAKNNTYSVSTPPPIIGYWVLPGSSSAYTTTFAGYSKPNWFHRKMMQVVLGWKWKDD
jgi:hypothetical protein